MLNSDFLKRRVVIYARVSTEHEAQLSALENQIDWYKPILAARPEWTLVGQYIDEGITGTSAEKRPQFMQMIRDAKQHKFDMIITREVSRFARNTVDTLQYTRMLREVGVEVFFINDNIKTFDGDGELRLTIMATLAQDESRKTSVRVKAGQQTSMNNGVLYGNGNILGYDRVGKELVINPEQAKTVRMIYDMYLDGYGMAKIKNELERQGRLTSMGMKQWHQTVISHILKNSFYCGIITYHKEYTPDYLKQKRFKNYGEMEFTQVQGTHQPIVTVEEFERVQRIMATKRGAINNSGDSRECRGKTPASYVWSRLLICSCGHKFSRIKWTGKGDKTKYAYRCYYSIRTGTYEGRLKKGLPVDDVCRVPAVPEWKLQMMAKFIFNRYLAHKDQVLALANSMLAAHIGDAEEKKDNSELLASKKAELDKLKKRMDKLLELCTDDAITVQQYKERTAEITPDMEMLKAEIAELEPTEAEEVTENYEEKITFLRYALEQYTNFDEAGLIPEQVIEAFVEKIIVYPDRFEWYLRFGGDDGPIKCKTEGHRQKDCEIVTGSVEDTPAALEQPRLLLQLAGNKIPETYRVHSYKGRCRGVCQHHDEEPQSEMLEGYKSYIVCIIAAPALFEAGAVCA